jgi:hypothetical protein
MSALTYHQFFAELMFSYLDYIVVYTDGSSAHGSPGWALNPMPCIPLSAIGVSYPLYRILKCHNYTTEYLAIMEIWHQVFTISKADVCMVMQACPAVKLLIQPTAAKRQEALHGDLTPDTALGNDVHMLLSLLPR